MAAPNEFNQKIIDEFRANEGKVGGYFEGRNMVLVSYRGAKSGEEMITPLVYSKDGARMVVIASMGGAPKHPAWYFNLKANPDVTIEAGTETYAATATEVTGAERDRLYAQQAAEMPVFNDYQKNAGTRTIPVFVIERK